VFVPFCVSLGGEDDFEVGDDEPIVDDDVEARIQELETLSSLTEPTSESSDLVNRVHH
jgi:hypothetical protein